MVYKEHYSNPKKKERSCHRLLILKTLIVSFNSFRRLLRNNVIT
jgi:hypothetical protein